MQRKGNESGRGSSKEVRIAFGDEIMFLQTQKQLAGNKHVIDIFTSEGMKNILRRTYNTLLLIRYYV